MVACCRAGGTEGSSACRGPFEGGHHYLHYLHHSLALVAQGLKRLPAVQETWVGSLSREDPLEKEMATHSSILARRIPWTEEPGRLQSMGSQSQTGLSNFTFTFN